MARRFGPACACIRVCVAFDTRRVTFRSVTMRQGYVHVHVHSLMKRKADIRGHKTGPSQRYIYVHQKHYKYGYIVYRSLVISCFVVDVSAKTRRPRKYVYVCAESRLFRPVQ